MNYFDMTRIEHYFFLLKHFCTLGSNISTTILHNEIVDLSGSRTRIVGVGGKRADHLTTTTALFH